MDQTSPVNARPSQRIATKLVAAALGALTIASVVAAVVWTVVSASALSHTFDEPHHLATGLEWWQFGTYRWWTENPPLPKVVTALVPYLAGLRLPDRPAVLGSFPWGAGIELLDGGAGYEHTLLLARVGTLLFLLLTLGLTFALAGGRKRLFPAFLATALVATYPPLLGHAGFATTDVATVATVLLFLLAIDRWADRPSRLRAIALGSAFALAALCKLTAPLLCSVLGPAWLGGRRWSRGAWLAAGGSLRRREMIGQAAMASVAAFVVVWAGYRFSIGRIDDIPRMEYIGTPLLPPPDQRSALLGWVCRLPLPAPEFWHGYLFLKAHSAHGHAAFLFGQIREHGFWSFYLVGLLLKSPLPFLLLVVASVPALFWRKDGHAPNRRALGAGLAAIASLALSTVVTVNIGLRHFLIAVPLLAIFIGGAVAPWIEGLASPRRVIAGTALFSLLAAEVAIVESARPELMAYFNPLAGREPGRALIDSDLDWGQDFLLLERELAARRISSIHYGFFGTVNPCGPGLPQLLPLVPGKPVTGWIVLSEQFYRSNFFVSFRRESCDPTGHYSFKMAPGDAFNWIKVHEPVARIGASLRLYHLPDR